MRLVDFGMAVVGFANEDRHRIMRRIAPVATAIRIELWQNAVEAPFVKLEVELASAVSPEASRSPRGDFDGVHTARESIDRAALLGAWWRRHEAADAQVTVLAAIARAAERIGLAPLAAITQRLREHGIGRHELPWLGATDPATGARVAMCYEVDEKGARVVAEVIDARGERREHLIAGDRDALPPDLLMPAVCGRIVRDDTLVLVDIEGASIVRISMRDADEAPELALGDAGAHDLAEILADHWRDHHRVPTLNVRPRPWR